MVFVLSALINMRHLLAVKRKKSNAAAILVISLFLTLPLSAKAQFSLLPLSQSEIQAALFDTKLVGEYSNGQRWSEFLNNDMTSIYIEDSYTMAGQIRFKGSVLCFTYPQSEDPLPHCFEIWQRGANCFDFYGADGSTTLMDTRLGRNWLARAWRADKTSTCQSDLIG